MQNINLQRVIEVMQEMKPATQNSGKNYYQMKQNEIKLSIAEIKQQLNNKQQSDISIDTLTGFINEFLFKEPEPMQCLNYSIIFLQNMLLSTFLNCKQLKLSTEDCSEIAFNVLKVIVRDLQQLVEINKLREDYSKTVQLVKIFFYFQGQIRLSLTNCYFIINRKLSIGSFELMEQFQSVSTILRCQQLNSQQKEKLYLCLNDFELHQLAFNIVFENYRNYKEFEKGFETGNYGECLCNNIQLLLKINNQVTQYFLQDYYNVVQFLLALAASKQLSQSFNQQLVNLTVAEMKKKIEHLKFQVTQQQINGTLSSIESLSKRLSDSIYAIDDAVAVLSLADDDFLQISSYQLYQYKAYRAFIQNHDQSFIDQLGYVMKMPSLNEALTKLNIAVPVFTDKTETVQKIITFPLRSFAQICVCDFIVEQQFQNLQIHSSLQQCGAYGEDFVVKQPTQAMVVNKECPIDFSVIYEYPTVNKDEVGKYCFRKYKNTVYMVKLVGVGDVQKWGVGDEEIGRWVAGQ